MKGEQLTFKIWDNVDFGFQQFDTKWYMSSRKRDQQLSESDASKRVKITLTKIANNGHTLKTIILQDFNQGSSLTHGHTFTEPGNYVYEASLDRDNSGYKVFVRVMESEYYGAGDEGRVKVRDFMPREIEYINTVLSDDKKITIDDYKLAMVMDVKASYVWKQPKDGGAPRSYMNSDGTVKYIDRFAPFNDYADHYVYQINDNSGVKISKQNVSAVQEYITTRDSQFKLLPGTWVNHLDPLGDSPTKYGVQDEFDLGDRIQNINSQFVDNLFNEVQVTYADQYMVNFNGKMINSRNPRDWEVRLPWSSLSKYYGFRLRTAPKSPINATALKEAILKIGKKGGGYFESFGIWGSGLGFRESGNVSGSRNLGIGSSSVNGSNLINPLLNPKNGFLDTDEQKLEYAFFLNLKHNRWVVIPNTTDNVIFYHGDDQDNQVASGFVSDNIALSGLIPKRLPLGNYFILNKKNKCFYNTNNGLKWSTYIDSDGNINKNLCTLVNVSDVDVSTNNSRTIQLVDQKKYIQIDIATNNLGVSDNKLEIIPYQTNQEFIYGEYYLGDNSGTNITKQTYKMLEQTILSNSTTSNSASKVAHSVSAGTIIGGVLGGGSAGLIGYGFFKYTKRALAENLGECIDNCQIWKRVK